MQERLQSLVADARNGSRRAVARLITTVEQGGEPAATAVKLLYPYTGHAHIIGVTGAPGAGKSTLVNSLALALRERDETVAIIAVDPTSPFSGGALLGDRIRMSDLYGDAGVFIRSMASRGHLGGLAVASRDAVRVLDAAGYDRVVIETVGAGQAEVDIAGAAQTTLVIEAPGMGDDIQTIKAGILEIADILVVNKADRPHSDNTVRALRAMLKLGQDVRLRAQGGYGKVPTADDVRWEPPIVKTIAPDGDGIDQLLSAIDAHRRHLSETTAGVRRARLNVQRELQQLAWRQLEQMWQTQLADDVEETLITAVVERQIDPYSAAATLLRYVNRAA